VTTLAFVGGTLIDGTGAPPRQLRSLLVNDGVIASIDVFDPANPTPAPTPRADRIVDLAGGFLLPGLWDAHAHLGMVFPQTDLSKTPHHERPSDRTVRCGRAAMQALEHGVTALRIVGEADYVDVAWKRAFERWEFVGPRMFVAGRALIATGGHGWASGTSVEVDGPYEVRRAAREQLRQGADWIKLMITGGVASSTETMVETQMTMDEIEAAVAVAKIKGKRVAAHIGGAEGAKMAVRAGVASIEHGYHLDDEAIAMMVDHGTTYVPTLAVTQDMEFVLANNAEFAIKKILAAAPQHLESFQRALAAGVRIATGEDMPVPFAERVVPEIETMVRAGMSPMAAIVASTRNAAELCDVGDRVGTVSVGKLADLIVLDADPLADVGNLRALRLVFKEGRLVHDRRPTALP
jgi:imidazolonepropionase-like amidohydrolase